MSAYEHSACCRQGGFGHFLALNRFLGVLAGPVEERAQSSNSKGAEPSERAEKVQHHASGLEEAKAMVFVSSVSSSLRVPSAASTLSWILSLDHSIQPR